jgi:hypothetical protein
MMVVVTTKVLALLALATLVLPTKALTIPRRLKLYHQRIETIRYNVWSNPQAVEDYQALLSGVIEEVTVDTDAVLVVGKGMREQNLAKYSAFP